MANEKKVPLVCHYSFDPEVSVWLFDTEDEALAELKRQFEEELRIQIDENGHVLDEDLVTDVDTSGYWASIPIYWDENEDVQTWAIRQAKN